jgi:glycerophosphoryl diester phosphodiesterase
MDLSPGAPRRDLISRKKPGASPPFAIHRASLTSCRMRRNYLCHHGNFIRRPTNRNTPRVIPTAWTQKILEGGISMGKRMAMIGVVAAVTACSGYLAVSTADNERGSHERSRNIQVGPRPYFLVDDMDPGPLKTALQKCSDQTLRKTDFSIGHRGAALQFPEHTKESYEAAARMGAGILECDVTFTKDKQLVCRHAQNDLHTTTNILETPLAAKCTKGFTPATFNPDGSLNAPASAECRTSDITLAEFKTLTGKMDAFNPRATTGAEFLGGTANFRTDLYASRGTLLTHAESIQLFKKLGVKMTPELKFPTVAMPFEGFTQEQYAQKMIDEYKAARVSPNDVWPQSFNQPDVLYWIKKEPAFGKQAVYLDDAQVPADLPSASELKSYAKQGIQIVAPPLWALVTLQGNRIVPSQYSVNAKAAGLDIITWTLERSGTLTDGGGFYYQTIAPVINKSGDTYELLDVIARQVGVLGVFSDWPATVTYYANCMKLK